MIKWNTREIKNTHIEINEKNTWEMKTRGILNGWQLSYPLVDRNSTVKLCLILLNRQTGRIDQC